MGNIAVGAAADAAAGDAGRLDQALQRSAGGASASTKVLRGRRLAIGFDNIDSARFGGKVHLRFTEFDAFLCAAALQLTGTVVAVAAINGITIDMHLEVGMQVV